MRLRFGQSLKQCRAVAGLTQEELGARAGICYKYVGAIERGERNPSLEVLHKIATALDIDITELISFSNKDAVDCEYRMLINRILRKRDTEALYKVLRVMQIVFDFEEGKIGPKGIRGIITRYAEKTE